MAGPRAYCPYAKLLCNAAASSHNDVQRAEMSFDLDFPSSPSLAGVVPLHDITVEQKADCNGVCTSCVYVEMSSFICLCGSSVN